MRKIIGVLICTFLLASFAAGASAQSSPCIHFGTGLTPPFPPGYISCEYQMWSFGSWTCAFFSCPPAAAVSEACQTCMKGGAPPSGGAPINLLTGNTFIEETDVRIPGLSNGLVLSRTWNSKWPSTQTSSQVGLFGPNWRSTYEERIFLGSDNYIKYARSDGSFWSLAGAGTLYPVAPANVAASLTVDGGYTQWTLTFQNGEKRIFNYLSGWLTAIIDRNGNTTQLTYDSTNRLTTVTDPAGRHLYFGYASGSSFLVTGVTSDLGLTLAYSYDTQGRLIQVTKPDLTTLSFAYDANSRITAVTDANGNILESHTYDSQGRGLTSSRAGGAEAITVSYPN